MKAIAIVAGLTIGCATVGTNDIGYVGSNAGVQRLAAAARHCGIQGIRIVPVREVCSGCGDADRFALYISKSASGGSDPQECVRRWLDDNKDAIDHVMVMVPH